MKIKYTQKGHIHNNKETLRLITHTHTYTHIHTHTHTASKYLSTMSFLSSLEVMCGSRKSALALRKHSAYVDFMHVSAAQICVFYRAVLLLRPF